MSVNKLIKSSVMVALVALIIGGASAATVTDDFNRLDNDNVGDNWYDFKTYYSINDSEMYENVNTGTYPVISRQIDLSSKNYTVNISVKRINTSAADFFNLWFYLQEVDKNAVLNSRGYAIQFRSTDNNARPLYANGTSAGSNLNVGQPFQDTTNYSFAINGTNVSIYINDTYKGYLLFPSNFVNGTVALGGYFTSATLSKSFDNFVANGSELIAFDVNGTGGGGGATPQETYYVAVDGNNSNNGTFAFPKQNFSHTWFNTALVLPGTTIWVMNGTWTNDSIQLTSIAGTTIYARGNETHQLRILAYNGTPTFDGYNYSNSNNFGVVMENALYTDFQNINISGITFKNYYFGVESRNTTNVTLDNVSILDSGYMAIRDTDSVNFYVNGGVYDNVGLVSTACSCNSMQFKANRRNITGLRIENTTISNNTKHNLIDLFNYNATGVYGISDVYILNNILQNTPYIADAAHYGNNTNSKQNFSNINIINNTINNVSSGLHLDGFVDSNISNNIIGNSPVYGITTQSASTYWGGGNNTIRNNTVYNNGAEGGDVYISSRSDDPDVFDSNNISYYTSRLQGHLTVLNSIKDNFTIESNGGGNVSVNYTGGFLISENGANITYYYLDRSEYRTLGIEAVDIQKYNITIQPSANNVTATNTSSDIIINYQGNTIPRLNITNNENAKSFNLTGLNNGIFYRRMFSNGTEETANIPVINGMINFSAVTGSYYILEAPAAPASGSCTQLEHGLLSLVGTMFIILLTLAVVAFVYSTSRNPVYAVITIMLIVVVGLGTGWPIIDGAISGACP